MQEQYSKKKTTIAIGSIIATGLIILGLFYHFNSWSVVPAQIEVDLQLANESYDAETSYIDEELSANGFTEEFYNRATNASEEALKKIAAEKALDETISQNKSRNIFETNAAWFFAAAVIVLLSTIVISIKLD